VGRTSKRSRSRAEPAPSGGEGGFTLAEVLIAIAILGIITTAIAAAFITTGKSSVGVAARFDQSHDAQIASAYLATDVQSNAALTNTACGAGGTPIVNFGYADGSIATYAYGVVGSETRLMRRYCSGGNTTNAVLVHYGGGTPTLTCDGAACNVGTTPQPNKVEISIPERNSATNAVDYTYALSGSRRPCINNVVGTTTSTTFPVCGGSPSTLAPPAPYGLIALNNGTVSLGGNPQLSLTVYGPMVIDSTSPSAVSVGGASPSPGNQRLRVLANPTSGLPAYFGIRNYGQPGGGACNGCNAAKVLPYPPQSFSDPIIDPFIGLPYPDEAGLPVYTNGVYQGPGVYRGTPLSFSGNSQTFDLAAGTYILEAGMRVSGNGNTVRGTDVLLFNGCGRNSGGACTEGTGTGQFNLAGQNTTLLIDPPQTGQYQFLLMWQPTGNTQGITIAGGAAASLLKGIVYAPGSTGLSMGSGGSTLQIWCVAGTNITLTGTGNVIVGK
jgi:prepilin-type N-terminal cleavage/methylation domain-containing protein